MGGSGQHDRSPRGEVKGWTKGAARRQRQWAWTVNIAELGAHGYSATLTLLDTPPDAETFHRMRDNYLKQLRRMGMIYGHWVIEWQERGTPHLHMALYFDHALSFEEYESLKWRWLQLATGYGARYVAQDTKPIFDAQGWVKYLAKHVDRGVYHYQRQGRPEGWEKSGRLWGSVGSWPVVEPLVFEDLSNAQFYRLRRMMRAWTVADARKTGDVGRLRYLRRVRANADQVKSRRLGSAEWIPEVPMLRLVDFLEREAGRGAR